MGTIYLWTQMGDGAMSKGFVTQGGDLACGGEGWAFRHDTALTYRRASIAQSPHHLCFGLCRHPSGVVWAHIIWASAGLPRQATKDVHSGVGSSKTTVEHSAGKLDAVQKDCHRRNNQNWY